MILDAITNPLATVAADRSPLSDFWYKPVSQQSAGVDITDAVALAVSTNYACIRLLGDTLGILPAFVFERLGEGENVRAPDHPWYRTIHDSPNVWQTPIDWRAMGAAHLGLRGNFYNLIDFGRTDLEPGTPQLIPLSPDRMTVEQLPTTKRLVYRYKQQDGTQTDYSQDDIYHVKLMPLDGITGTTPLTFAAGTIGISTARKQFDAGMYSGGGFIKYYLTQPGPHSKDFRENFRSKWKDVHGTKPGQPYEPPMLDMGAEIKHLGMSNVEMQTIEAEGISQIEICQFWGVPPHMVQVLTDATFNNIEHQGASFKSVHFPPWAVRFEQSFERHFQDPVKFFAEFNIDGLMRGNTEVRNEAYSKATGGSPWMTVNEVRALENLPPLDGGDELQQPLNMAAPGPPGEQTGLASEPAAPPTEPAALNVGPLLESAAVRIVNRERTALESRAKRYADDRPAWDAWIKDWYVGQSRYMTEALTPINEAAGSPLNDVEGLSDKLCLWAMTELSLTDMSCVAAYLIDWRTGRLPFMIEQLKGAFSCQPQ